MRKDPWNNPLHVRMYFKHGAYWYVYRGKWVNIGKDYTTAMQNYSAAVAPSGGMAKLIADTFRWYEKRAERTKAGKSGGKDRMSEKSLRQYKMVREQIDVSFEAFAPSQVRTHHISTFLDFFYEDRQAMGNTALVVLKATFARGVRWGLCEFNPATEAQRFERNRRTRYLTDTEFLSIRSAADDWLKVIIDMCYLTGQRIGDVLNIKQADVSKTGIKFKQQKTSKRLEVIMTPELEKLVVQARGLSTVAGIYLFSKSATLPLHYSKVRRGWIEACEVARVEDARLHDLRAKAATDADAQGKDAQALMGHATPAMTENYLRLMRTDRVQSPVMIGGKQ